jgi:hypothetical protein
LYGLRVVGTAPRLRVPAIVASLSLLIPCCVLYYAAYRIPLAVAVVTGLAVVYLINAGLAAFAVLKAGERGQPGPLWALKTFSVGGLALDQLMQLPTLEEVERAKSRKGKRALKNRK